MIKKVFGAFAIALATTSAYSQPVSIEGYNLISANDKILKVVFPQGSGIKGNPIFSDDKQGVLLRFEKDSEGKVIYGNIETTNGVFALKLEPTSQVGPQTIVVGGDRADISVGNDSNPNRFLIPAFSQIIAMEEPKGYRSVSKNTNIRYSDFSAVLDAAWENGNFEISKYRLVADKNKSLKVDPSQFFEKGVRATSLSSNTIDENNQPVLIIAKDLKDVR